MSIIQRMFLLCIALCILTLSMCSLIGLTKPVSAASSIKDPLIPNQPALIATPNTLSSSNCSEDGSLWTCVVTLSGENAPPGGISWSAPVVNGVTFSPAGGVVPPDAAVTISGLPCPANENFTFTGTTARGFVTPATVFWNCAATPTPSPRPSPTPSPRPSPTATPSPSLERPTPSPTPRPKSATPTPTLNSVTPTPPSAPTPTPSRAQTNSNTPPPGSGGNSSGGSPVGILLTLSALVMAMLAFLLYLLPRGQASLLKRSLALIVPVSLLRRFVDS